MMCIVGDLCFQTPNSSKQRVTFSISKQIHCSAKKRTTYSNRFSLKATCLFIKLSRVKYFIIFVCLKSDIIIYFPQKTVIINITFRALNIFGNASNEEFSKNNLLQLIARIFFKSNLLFEKTQQSKILCYFSAYISEMMQYVFLH